VNYRSVTVEILWARFNNQRFTLGVNPKTCIQIVPYFRHIYQKCETLMLLFMYQSTLTSLLLVRTNQPNI